jgi:haloalkane dehalogenase
MNSNYFVNKVLPSGVFRKLSEEEMQNYLAPFKEPGSCKPLWQYIQDLPLGDGPEDVIELIKNYSQVLQCSEIPKLMLFAVPGFNTTINTVHWAKDHLPNIEIVDIGDGLHYAQETSPTKIGFVLKRWYNALLAVKEQSTEKISDLE